MPPFARRDKVADYVGSEACAGFGGSGKVGVGWREERMRSGDGVEVAVLVGGMRDDMEGDGDGMREGKREEVREKEGRRRRRRRRRRDIVVVYFQGYGYAFTDSELQYADIGVLVMALPCRHACQGSRSFLKVCLPARAPVIRLHTPS